MFGNIFYSIVAVRLLFLWPLRCPFRRRKSRRLFRFGMCLAGPFADKHIIINSSFFMFISTNIMWANSTVNRKGQKFLDEKCVADFPTRRTTVVIHTKMNRRQILLISFRWSLSMLLLIIHAERRTHATHPATDDDQNVVDDGRRTRNPNDGKKIRQIVRKSEQ